MPSMLSYPRRLPSGHFTCYLNRTYHVLTTSPNLLLTSTPMLGDAAVSACSKPGVWPTRMVLLGLHVRSSLPHMSWVLSARMRSRVGKKLRVSSRRNAGPPARAGRPCTGAARLSLAAPALI